MHKKDNLKFLTYSENRSKINDLQKNSKCSSSYTIKTNQQDLITEKYINFKTINLEMLRDILEIKDEEKNSISNSLNKNLESIDNFYDDSHISSPIIISRKKLPTSGNTDLPKIKKCKNHESKKIVTYINIKKFDNYVKNIFIKKSLVKNHINRQNSLKNKYKYFSQFSSKNVCNKLKIDYKINKILK